MNACSLKTGVNKQKGQTEFFAILGILIVVVVVAYSAYQLSTSQPQPTQQIAEEVKMTQASVENFIRSAVQDTLKKITTQGGYMQLPSNTVRFMQQDIPYWSYNGVVSIPDVKANFLSGLTDYLKSNKEGFASAFGKNVTIGEPSVTATISDNRIDLAITMPTTVSGYNIPQPYKLSIPSKLGEIYDFAKNFINEQKNRRFFEVFTISSMALSPIEDGVQTIPISILLTECGDFVYRGWDDIKPNMEQEIKITLANTYMPGKTPMNTYETSPNPKYMIPTLNGKRYESINVSFFLPDDFELDRTNFGFTPEPIIVYAEPIPLLGACVSKPNYINYYVNYPVVARIKDTLTGNTFQFGFNVYIKDNKAGSFANTSGYIPEDRARICANPLCSARVIVKDLSGNPVPYASVSFLGCEIGKTDVNGVVEGKAVCGAGDLSVYKNGYGSFVWSYSIDELKGAIVTIPKKPIINIYFHEVILQNLTDRYQINADGIKWLGERVEGLNEQKQKDVVQIVLFNRDGQKCDNDVCTRIFNTKAGQLKNVPAGNYTIAATLTSENLITTYGSAVADYSIKEDYGMGEGIHVYVPYNTMDFANVKDNMDFIGKTGVYMDVFRRCGIPVITENPIDEGNFKGCIISTGQAS